MSSGPGIYRGICAEVMDPLRQGRIRVQVPGLLGPLASGWAFPAWGLTELGIYPEDRVPRPGQGVWVVVEGDQLFWFAVYGEQSQPVPEVYAPVIEWVLPVMPADTPVEVAGVLASKMGTPNPNPVVWLQSKAGSVWRDDAWLNIDLDGAFSFTVTRTDEEMFRIWFPGCGPFPELYSDERVPPEPPNTALISWTPPAGVWQIGEDVRGVLATEPDAQASQGLLVRIMVRDAGASGGSWGQEASGVAARFGLWSIPWTRTRTGPVHVKAVFTGDGTAGYAETAHTALPAVEVHPVLTLDLGSMALGRAGPVTGTATTAYGPPPGVVALQAMVPGGAWTDVLSAAPRADGSWTMLYTPDRPVASYRARYAGSGVYREAVSPVQHRELTQETSTTLNVPPAPALGIAASWTGSVAGVLGNADGGRVEILRRVPGGSWSVFATAAVSGGSFTAPGVPDVLGPAEWRADFSGHGPSGMLPSSSPVVQRAVGLGVPVVSKGSVGYSSASLSWAAVPGATVYEVVRNSVRVQSSAALSHTSSGLSVLTDYSFQVRAGALDHKGAQVYSAWSPAARMTTGRAEQRSTGSFERRMSPTATRSWRPLDGFGHPFGDQVVQGVYGSSGNYQGVMTYDGPGFRSWVSSTYGAAVLANLVWSRARVAMYRTGDGGYTSGVMSMLWYVTSAAAGQPGPYSYAGGSWFGSLAWNQSAWVDLPAHWAGHVLLNQNVPGTGACRSFMLMNNAASSYMRLLGGSSGEACDLIVNCSWNFVAVSGAKPRWY